jgi:ATP-dependent RNA helicase DHX57
LEDDPINSKIVVVQPRRIAATGVANRVAEERGEKQVGSGSVGYVVRGDNALSDQSRLVFCTTGVLLRQFQIDGALDSFTTIVVDEVHERHLDCDILLGLLKKILPNKPRLRVVLMSATLAMDKFRMYWGNTPVPHVHLPGRTFPVNDFFLEDVLSLTGFIPTKKQKGYRSKTSPRNVQGDHEGPIVDDNEKDHQIKDTSRRDIPIEVRLKRIDETAPDPDLVCKLLEHIILKRDSSDNGSILVFLAGAPEIKIVETAIKNGLVGLSITILPLHGGLQAKEQRRVFQPASAGFTKIILSTNVAETSITIPDCTIVIDT